MKQAAGELFASVGDNPRLGWAHAPVQPSAALLMQRRASARPLSYLCGIGRRHTPWLARRLTLTVTLLTFAIDTSAAAQVAEETLVLTPNFGGPTDTFTATYDVNSGGCRDPDGKMVHFYWFGGVSSITVIGKAPLVKCVASLTTAPPAGTPPGEYVVGADLFSPGGPQRPQHGTYRVVDGAARSGANPPASARGGSSSTTPGPGADSDGPSGAQDATWGATGSSPAAGPGGPGTATDARKGAAGASPAEAGNADPSSPADDGSGQSLSASEPRCAVQKVDCQVETEADGDRRVFVAIAFVFVLLVGFALLAALSKATRRRRKATEAVSA